MSHSSINLENELLKLTLYLYSNPVIPRNVVQIVMEAVTNFFSEAYLNYMQQQIQLKSTTLHLRFAECVFDIMKSTKSVFEKFSTEHRRFSVYKEKGLMIDPIRLTIGTNVKFPLEYQDEFSSKIDIDDTSKNYVTAEYIPLKWSLKALLEIPGT